jgi:hypothetical protein
MGDSDSFDIEDLIVIDLDIVPVIILDNAIVTSNPHHLSLHSPTQSSASPYALGTMALAGPFARKLAAGSAVFAPVCRCQNANCRNFRARGAIETPCGRVSITKSAKSSHSDQP